MNLLKPHPYTIPPINGWIPVSERLPTVSQDVPVLVPIGPYKKLTRFMYSYWYSEHSVSKVWCNDQGDPIEDGDLYLPVFWFDLPTDPDKLPAAKSSRVCGLQGYNGMIDPPCPGCEANRK
jgi:hypothetical protein